jgi:alanine racemase
LNEFPLQPRPGADTIRPEEAGGLLTIDLAALVSNWRALRDRAGSAECSAVVKADAYGTGIEKTVPPLVRAGCRTFFVAHLAEAIRVRNVAPDATIYVLNGLPPGTGSTYAVSNLRPVLGSREEIDEWTGFCRAEARKLPAAIHVDTGMNRLGLSVREGLALKGDRRLNDFEPALLMSHFVSAEEPENPINARQIGAFEAVRQALPGIPASLANSAGIFLKEAPHYDLVRPGYALYGGNPTPDRDTPMRPVVRLQGRIVQVRSVRDGETVGYNAQWTAHDPRRIATISVGYADGYARAASRTDDKNRAEAPAGEAIVRGRRCPFAGRVSMDLITLDVTAIPADELRRGDLVTLIGDDLTIDEVGRRAGTIGYEILTNLGRRYARAYLGENG